MIVPVCLLNETACHYWMKRLKLDPDTSVLMKAGLVDFAFEVIKDVLFFFLHLTQ